MQLINKQIKYSCIKSGDKLKINGTICISKDEFLFSGNFNTLDNNYCGDFIYSEGDKINTSINNISSEYILDCYKFLLEIVEEAKNNLLINDYDFK